MSVRYIDEDYVYAHIGADVVRSAMAQSKADLTLLIEDSSGSVRGVLRSKGARAPDTLDPTTVTDVNIKLATVWALRCLMNSLPSVRLPLPDNWEANPEYLAYYGFYSGRTQPDVIDDNKSTPGGWGFVGSSGTGSSSAGLAAKLSADQLKVL